MTHVLIVHANYIVLVHTSIIPPLYYHKIIFTKKNCVVLIQMVCEIFVVPTMHFCIISFNKLFNYQETDTK